MPDNTLGIAAIILLFLIQIGIFAKKEDTGKLWTAISDLKAHIAEKYVHKDTLTELKSGMKDINIKLDNLTMMMIRKDEHNEQSNR